MKKINSPDWMIKLKERIEKEEGVSLTLESFRSEDNGLTMAENHEKNQRQFKKISAKTNEQRFIYRELTNAVFWSKIKEAKENSD